MKSFKAPAYPIVTVDPYFSIWSFTDNLAENYTKHWTGRPAPIYMATVIDSKQYPICVFDENNVNRALETERLIQTDVRISPLSTVYTFENDKIVLTVDFTTPLLIEKPEIMSRPVSYIEYNIEKKDASVKDVSFIFGISSECCVNSKDSEVVFKKTPYSLSCGNAVQNVLSEVGDSVMINWGYLHLCDTDAEAVTVYDSFTPNAPYKKADINARYNAYRDKVYLAVEKKEQSGTITLAYDDIKAIEYFGEQCGGYYTKFFKSFGDMVKAAKEEYEDIKAQCNSFDNRLTNEANKYGEEYARIAILSYRQCVSAHKLIEKDGEMIFLSKECHSNGCIGTLDVTYPSIPLFLKYNPSLVTAMLRPIIKYAKTDEWKFDFTPHDVGTYPLANGQVYGMKEPLNPDKQMPVEECGNMLLCMAAVDKYSGDKTLFEENRLLIKKWADYLVKYGYDPGKQLCTDDFAGHLDRNCNLSLKAILGICAYAQLSGETEYHDIALQYAKKWEKDAANSFGTKLTFDKEDSWSLKYNMVWDSILGYNLFSEEVKRKETEVYLTKLNRYGVPLDSRSDYTKLDWLLWSTRLSENQEYFDKAVKSIIYMMEETLDRVPLTDWYCTKSALHYFFQARSVVGGIYITMI